MRVDEREALAGVQVLYRQRFDQCGLADARLPDDVDMKEAVILLDAKKRVRTSRIRARKI
jgi:hypothetical protein